MGRTVKAPFDFVEEGNSCYVFVEIVKLCFGFAQNANHVRVACVIKAPIIFSVLHFPLINSGKCVF